MTLNEIGFFFVFNPLRGPTHSKNEGSNNSDGKTETGEPTYSKKKNKKKKTQVLISSQLRTF